MNTTMVAAATLIFARACIPPGGITDPDEDYLTNSIERQMGTDPRNPDSDFDDLRDNDELDVGTDPLNPDTDGDVVLDGIEVRFGLDPLFPDAPTGQLAIALDTHAVWRVRGEAPFSTFELVPGEWPVAVFMPDQAVPELVCAGTGLDLSCHDAIDALDDRRWSLTGYLDEGDIPVMRFTLSLQTGGALQEWVFNAVEFPGALGG